MRIKSRILSNSAKFSADRSLLAAYSFSATMASTSNTYRFGAVPSLKSLATENITTITVSIFKDCRQSEPSNFETAEHIDKRISDVSSRINALQNGYQTWSHHPRVFFCNLGRKWANAINDARKLAYFVHAIAQKFLLVGRNNSFSVTMASIFNTYRLGTVACLKLLATENMRRITVKLHIVDYSRQ